MSKTDPIKISGVNRVLAKDKQFLLLIWGYPTNSV